MISMARTFGAPDSVPAGKVALKTSKQSLPSGELRLDVGNKMHDVGISFHDHELVHLDAADPRDPAQVVSPQIDEHDVFRPLLRIVAAVHRKGAGLPVRFVPRSLVPAMGRNSTSPSSRRTMTSGEEPIRIISSSLRKKR